MSNQTTTYAIFGECRATGQEGKLGMSKKLPNLLGRLLKDAELWRDMGWECFSLQDNSLGFYTDVLYEDLRGKYIRKEIDHETFKQLRHHCAH